MEQRSILGSIVNYLQYDRHSKNFHNLDIKAVNQKNHKRRPNTKEEKKMLDFRDTPEKLKEEYLDLYKGIQSEIVSTNRFDGNSDLSTTYLGKLDTTRVSKDQSGRKVSYVRTMVHSRKAIGWNRMSDTIGYRS